MSRATLVGLIEKFSLVVVESSLGDDAFVHRVDQSIERDVIVARRT
jgi:hypothetical protein